MTVLLGGIIGLVLGNRIPERIRQMFFHGIGLFTILLGISMALQTANPLILVLAMVTGGLLGEWLWLEEGMDRFVNRIKTRVGGGAVHFSEGLVTAFLLFCMGSMTLLGAIEEGLGGRPDLLITKSIMDGLSAIALTAALGIGVIFSIIPLLLYQGGLTLLARMMEPMLTETIIMEITACGGLILIGLGLQILEIKRFRIVNFLPALVLAVILSVIFQKIGLF